MSSTINPAGAATGQPQHNGQTQPQIIHFDATVRRKEKMRQKAIGTPAAAAPAVNGHAVAAAPVAQTAAPQAPVAPAPVAQPAPAPAAVAPAQPVAPAPQPAAPVAAAQPSNNSPAAADDSNKRKLSVKELEQFLIDFVVEQTGYPAEMVELDADLEADLGIDSIKKAQMFGEIAEQVVLDVEIELSADMSLDDFPTLRSIIEFISTPGPASGSAAPAAPAPAAASPAPAAPAPVATAAPVAPAAPAPVAAAPAPVQPVAAPAMPQPVQAAAPAAAMPSPATATPAAPAAAPAAAPMTASSNGAAVASASTVQKKKMTPAELEQFLIDFVVEQTGYPAEMVEVDADLEADLGIDSIKKAQMFGEIAEQVELDREIELSADMSLDDFPTLRSITEFIQNS